MLSRKELESRFKNEIYPKLSDERREEILDNFKSLTPQSQEEILTALMQLLNDNSINNRNILEVGKIIDTGVEDKQKADRLYADLLNQFNEEVAPYLSAGRRDEISTAFSRMEVEEQRKMLSEFRKILQKHKKLDMSDKSEEELKEEIDDPIRQRPSQDKIIEL